MVETAAPDPRARDCAGPTRAASDRTPLPGDHHRMQVLNARPHLQQVAARLFPAAPCGSPAPPLPACVACASAGCRASSGRRPVGGTNAAHDRMTAPASTASTRRTGTRNARSFSNERGDPQLRAAVGRPDYRRGNDEKNTKDGEGNGRIGSCFANHTVEKKEEEEHADNRDDNGHGNRGAGLYPRGSDTRPDRRRGRTPGDRAG